MCQQSTKDITRALKKYIEYVYASDDLAWEKRDKILDIFDEIYDDYKWFMTFNSDGSYNLERLTWPEYILRAMKGYALSDLVDGFDRMDVRVQEEVRKKLISLGGSI